MDKLFKLDAKNAAKDLKLNSVIKGMKSRGMAISFLISFFVLLTPALATSVTQMVEINGQAFINTTFDDGTSQLFQVINVDGVAYLNITFDDGSTGLLALEQYIEQNEAGWSQSDGVGMSTDDFMWYIQKAIDWLKSKVNGNGNGNGDIPERSKQIGRALDSYFASDSDIAMIVTKLNEYEIRITFLENAMEDSAAEAYCQGKLTTMQEYNLTWIKCGRNSTYYWNVDPNNYQGNSIISITGVEPVIKTTSPNITITEFNPPEFTAGTNTIVSITIKNSGNEKGSVNVSLEVPSGWTITPSIVTVTLEPGEEMTLDFMVAVPKDAESERMTGFVSYIFKDKENTDSMEKDAVVIKPKIEPAQAMTGMLVSIAMNPVYAFGAAAAAIFGVLYTLRYNLLIKKKPWKFMYNHKSSLHKSKVLGKLKLQTKMHMRR